MVGRHATARKSLDSYHAGVAVRRQSFCQAQQVEAAFRQCAAMALVQLEIARVRQGRLQRRLSEGPAAGEAAGPRPRSKPGDRLPYFPETDRTASKCKTVWGRVTRKRSSSG